LEQLEANQNRAINSQTCVVTKIDGELADIGLEVQAINEGIKTAVTRIDKDLEALDQRINRRHVECERMEQSLCSALNQIADLERLSHAQSEINNTLLERVDAMEGNLCHCNQDSCGSTQEAPSSLVGSPLEFGHQVDEGNVSDDSYHTPPLAGSSVPSIPSLIVEDSEQKNSSNVGIGYIPCVPLSDITDGLVENSGPIPVPAPVLDRAGINRLIAVRGQRAVRTLGRLKSYHPYPRCCAIGCQSSTHRAGSCCSHWGQGPVYQAGTSQIHHKEMDSVPCMCPPSTSQIFSEFSLLVSP